jgi:hypothetical protein
MHALEVRVIIYDGRQGAGHNISTVAPVSELGGAEWKQRDASLGVPLQQVLAVHPLPHPAVVPPRTRAQFPGTVRSEA